jgi:hypothetical protein
VDRLIALLDDKVETNINITNFLKRMTMDAIWNCAFGLDADIQNDLQNEYFSKSEAAFRGEGRTIFYTLSGNVNYSQSCLLKYVLMGLILLKNQLFK